MRGIARYGIYVWKRHGPHLHVVNPGTPPMCGNEMDHTYVLKTWTAPMHGRDMNHTYVSVLTSLLLFFALQVFLGIKISGVTNLFILLPFIGNCKLVLGRVIGICMAFLCMFQSVDAGCKYSRKTYFITLALIKL